MKLLDNLEVGLSCLVHVGAAVIVTPATRRPHALRGALPVSAMLAVLPVTTLVALVLLAAGLGPAALLGRKRLGCGRANLHQAEPRERMMVGGERSVTKHLQCVQKRNKHATCRLTNQRETVDKQLVCHLYLDAKTRPSCYPTQKEKRKTPAPHAPPCHRGNRDPPCFWARYRLGKVNHTKPRMIVEVRCCRGAGVEGHTNDLLLAREPLLGQRARLLRPLGRESVLGIDDSNRVIGTHDNN